MSAPFEITSLGGGVVSLRVASDDAPHLRFEDLPLLRAACDAIALDARVVLLEGGSRHFCAGAERELLLRPDAADAIDLLVGEVARRIVSIPVPTVAAMAGHATGGGLMLGLWCDVAVFAEESLYSANFLSLGFTPGMGSTALMAETFGAPLARELLLTGRALTGRELRAAVPTLAHAVMPRGEVRARALAVAEELALPAPHAVRLFKEHLARERRAALESALAHERRMHAAVFAHPDTRAHIDENYGEAG